MENLRRVPAARPESGPTAAGALAVVVAGLLVAVLGSGCGPDPQARGREAGPIPEAGDSPWLRAQRRGVDFRAVGNEPGWHLEVFRGDSLVLVTDYGRERTVFPWTEPTPQVEVEGTVQRTVADERELVVALRAEPCEDTMSGERFETDVTVRLDGRILRGCGRHLP